MRNKNRQKDEFISFQLKMKKSERKEKALNENNDVRGHEKNDCGVVFHLQVEAVTIGTSNGFLCQENNHGVWGSAHVVSSETRPERKNTLL